MTPILPAIAVLCLAMVVSWAIYFVCEVIEKALESLEEDERG